MVADVAPFHTIAISRMAHRMKAEGRSIIHMEFGQPSAGAPKAALAAAHRVLDSDGMGYWESTELKLRLAERYARYNGVAVDPERIVLTCGASPALVLALACLFEPGDAIAFARPGYIAYRNAVRALHLTPVEIACDGDSRFQLTAAHLASLDPPPAGLIIASPANPTGTIISAEDLAAIARLCRDRGIRILSDEIYHGLSYGAATHSLLEFDGEAAVVNSFSKYFSMAGWRLGWLVAPAQAVARARAYASNLFLTAPSLSQHAALAALDCGEELDERVAMYRANREAFLAALPDLGLSMIAPPDGAFYIYADVGHLTDDSLAFCESLLRDTGIAAATGLDFDPVDGNRFMRFSFAVSAAEMADALARLKPWFFRAQRG